VSIPRGGNFAGDRIGPYDPPAASTYSVVKEQTLQEGTTSQRETCRCSSIAKRQDFWLLQAELQVEGERFRGKGGVLTPWLAAAVAPDADAANLVRQSQRQ